MSVTAVSDVSLQIVRARLSGSAVQVTKSQPLGGRGLLDGVSGFTERRAQGKS